MKEKFKISYNPFFIFPFLCWVVAGAFILIGFTRRDIFYTVNTNYTDAADKIMYYATFLGQGEVIVPALLLLVIMVPAFRNWWYFFLALCCNLIPFLIQQGLKSVFDAPRPHLRFYDRTWIHSLPEWPLLYHRSFPSGHSQGAFSFFCFLSLLLPPRYNKLGIVFILLGLAVCYSRMYLAAHFFEDVYAGSLLGCTLTTIIYSVMMPYKDQFLNNEKPLI